MRLGALEIDRTFSPPKAQYDFVIEIGVSQKARPHALGV
jgi:hypothetical protein